MAQVVFELICVMLFCSSSSSKWVPGHTSLLQSEFFVAPDGDDANTGTFSDPFRTPARAQQAVRALARPLVGPVTVFLRPGSYDLNETLVLSAPDGGDGPDAQVVWKKFGSETDIVVLSGGGAVLTGWASTAADSKIWRAPLPNNLPISHTRQLFVDGRRRGLARFPAVSGPARADEFSDASTWHYASSLSGCNFHGPNDCYRAPQCPDSDAMGFIYGSPGPSPTWSDIPGISVLVFASWTAAWARVANIFEENSTLLTAVPLTIAPPGSQGANCTSGARYVLFNVREALVPGSTDFYVSDAERAVYYAPSAEELVAGPAALQAYMPALDSVITIAGSAAAPAQWLQVIGLNVTLSSDCGAREKFGFPPCGAVQIQQVDDVTLSGMSVSNAGGSGIWLGPGIRNLTIDSCNVRDTGGDGIGGEDMADALNPVITNTIVEGTGKIYLQQPSGLRIKSALPGTAIIAHNIVRDSSYSCIAVGWTDGTLKPADPYAWRYIVSQNLVEDCGQGILNDFGGIYVSASSYTCQGPPSTCFIPTLVDSNLVRRVTGYAGAGSGAYTDENVAGVFFSRNAFVDASQNALYLHCGNNQTAVNNIFYMAGSTRTRQGSAAVLGSCNTGGVAPPDENISATIDLNIFVVNGSFPTLFTPFEIYPTENMTFTRNCYWTVPNAPTFPPGNKLSFAQWQAQGMDKGSVVADPLISDAQASNFLLQPGSPALQLGFEQLDLSHIGPAGGVQEPQETARAVRARARVGRAEGL